MGCRILVWAEHEGGAIRETTHELLGLAHRLAGEAGWSAGEIKAVLLGLGPGPQADGLAARGAAEVICVTGDAVKDYTSDGFAQALEAVIAAETPEIVLAGHTPNGWDTAPMVAAGLGVPIATECSQIAFDGGRPLFTRKAFNGKFIQVIDLGDARPKIATVQKGAAAAHTGTTAGTVRVLPAAISADRMRARFVEIRKGEGGAVDLTQAPVIVSGGRGVGAPEKFSVIRDLAAALGGQVEIGRAHV